MNWKMRYWFLSAVFILVLLAPMGCDDPPRSASSMELVNTLFPNAQNKVVDGEGVTFDVTLGNKSRKLFLTEYSSTPIITCLEGCRESR